MNLICQCGHQRGDHRGMGPSRGKPVLSACGACSCQQWRPMKTPKELDAFVDAVLAYKPKPKTKAAKRRVRKAKRESKKNV
jgi:hypothetical protein